MFFFLLGWGGASGSQDIELNERMSIGCFCWRCSDVGKLKVFSLNTDYILHIHPCDIREPLMMMLTEMMTSDRWISMLRTLFYVCVVRSSLLPCESRLSFGAYHIISCLFGGVNPYHCILPSLGKSTHCMLELVNLKCNGKRAYNWRCRKCMNMNMRSSHT